VNQLKLISCNKVQQISLFIYIHLFHKYVDIVYNLNEDNTQYYEQTKRFNDTNDYFGDTIFHIFVPNNICRQILCSSLSYGHTFIQTYIHVYILRRHTYIYRYI
jgi:hypothetical protein